MARKRTLAGKYDVAVDATRPGHEKVRIGDVDVKYATQVTTCLRVGEVPVVEVWLTPGAVMAEVKEAEVTVHDDLQLVLDMAKFIMSLPVQEDYLKSAHRNLVDRILDSGVMKS